MLGWSQSCELYPLNPVSIHAGNKCQQTNQKPGSHVMNIKSTNNSVIAAVVFSVLSGVSSLGNATLNELDVESVRVSYADLNLTEKAGQQTLYQRIRNAADEVCGEVRSLTLSQVSEKRECVEKALNSAVHKVGNKDLITLNQQ
jgi:UrcA family protein